MGNRGNIPLQQEHVMELKCVVSSKGDVLHLSEMTSQDLKAAVQLIATIMDKDEAKYANKTMQYHFSSKRLSLDDGREYYLLKDGKQEVIGLLGLHHYEWGPSENVWLAWFGICQALRGQGIGRKMITIVEEFAYDKGYRKLFVETYSGSVFKDARYFYEKSGFRKAGVIAHYMPNGDDMIIYYKEIAKDFIEHAHSTS